MADQLDPRLQQQKVPILSDAQLDRHSLETIIGRTIFLGMLESFTSPRIVVRSIKNKMITNLVEWGKFRGSDAKVKTQIKKALDTAAGGGAADAAAAVANSNLLKLAWATVTELHVANDHGPIHHSGDKSGGVQDADESESSWGRY